MSFNLYQLDNLDYEEARCLLDDYFEELFAQFLNSEQGNVYQEQHRALGSWISHLIDYGYIYEGVTLTQMSVDNLQVVLEELFPQKICLSSPEEAAQIIPELIVFWQYLQQEYQLSEAPPILEYLHELEEHYPNLMNDPSQFGLAKSFVMMGQKAGFDMSTQEGLDAFALEYNSQMVPQMIEQSQPTWDFSPSPTVEQLLAAEIEDEKGFTSSISSKDKAKRKQRRKIAKASRKRNRKKRK